VEDEHRMVSFSDFDGNSLEEIKSPRISRKEVN
jgi:hypothetical protein